MSAVEALQTCLAAEHAAVYGYGVLGGVLAGVDAVGRSSRPRPTTATRPPGQPRRADQLISDRMADAGRGRAGLPTSVRGRGRGAAAARWRVLESRTARRSTPSRCRQTVTTEPARRRRHPHRLRRPRRGLGRATRRPSPASRRDPSAGSTPSAAGTASSRRTRARDSARRPRRVVGAPDQVGTGDRLEQQQMARLRLVQTADQPVDDPGRRARPEHEVRPAGAGETTPSSSATRLQRPDHVVPTATTRPPAALGGVDQPRRRLGDLEALRHRRLVLLGAGDPGVQDDGATATPSHISR